MGRISKEIKTQLALGIYTQYILAAFSTNLNKPWSYSAKLMSEQHDMICQQIKLFIPHSCELRKNHLLYSVASCNDAWVLLCSPQQLDLLTSNFINMKTNTPANWSGTSSIIWRTEITIFALNEPNGNWYLRDRV